MGSPTPEEIAAAKARLARHITYKRTGQVTAPGFEEPETARVDDIDALLALVSSLQAERDEARRAHDAQLRQATEARRLLRLKEADASRMREALEVVRPILTSLVAAEYNVETWGVRGRLIKLDAALSPTTPTDDGG